MHASLSICFSAALGSYWLASPNIQVLHYKHHPSWPNQRHQQQLAAARAATARPIGPIGSTPVSGAASTASISTDQDSSAATPQTVQPATPASSHGRHEPKQANQQGQMHHRRNNFNKQRPDNKQQQQQQWASQDPGQHQPQQQIGQQPKQNQHKQQQQQRHKQQQSCMQNAHATQQQGQQEGQQHDKQQQLQQLQQLLQHGKKLLQHGKKLQQGQQQDQQWQQYHSQQQQQPQHKQQQQQQQQQRPAVVLTPLSTAGASAGSASTSSPLGTWSLDTSNTALGYLQEKQKQQKQQQQARLAQQQLAHEKWKDELKQHRRHQRGLGIQAAEPRRPEREQQEREQQRQQYPQYKASMLTGRITRASSFDELLSALKDLRSQKAQNLIHVSTAYRVVADLVKQQHQQHQHQKLDVQQLQSTGQLRQRQQANQQQKPGHGQQWQQPQKEGPEGVVDDGPATADAVLQLLEDLTMAQLVGAVTGAANQRPASRAAASSSSSTAAASRDASSSSSAAAAAVSGHPSLVDPSQVKGWDARGLSTIVHSWGRLQQTPPWELLELVLEAFLLLLEQPRQQQQQQGQPQQQQQQHRQPSEPALKPQLSPKSANSSSRKGSGSGGGSGGSSGTAPQGNSGRNSGGQADCHALTLFCWGLGKIGFTCSEAYQPVSGSHDAWHCKQRLEQQQQYWARLAGTALRVFPGAASSRDLSALCYGFAAAGYKDVVLWGCLGSLVVASLKDFTPHELAQVLWAYATAGVPYQPLFEGAGSAVQHLMPGFSAQGLVNVLWAFTTVQGYVPSQLLAASTEECLIRDLTAFGSVNLTLLVWAHTKSKSMRPALGTAINQAVLQTLHMFSAENLCRLLGGLAVLSSLGEPLMAAAQPKLKQQLERGKLHAQVACQSVWAYAETAPDRARDLLPPLLALTSEHVRQLVRSSDATAKLCTTLGVLRYRDDEFMQKLVNHLLGSAESAKGPGPQAAAKAEPPAVEPAAIAASGFASAHEGMIGTGNPSSPLSRWHWGGRKAQRHLLGVAVGLARLGYSQHTQLLQALVEEFVQHCAAIDNSSNKRSNAGSVGNSGDDPGSSFQQQLQVQQVLVLLWCAAVLDMQAARPLTRLLQLLKGAVVEEVPTAGLAQLVQVHMWLQTLGEKGQSLGAMTPEALLSHALQVWKQQVVPAVITSDLQKEVLAELVTMQLQPVAEVVTPDGMFSIDIVVRYKGCAVALEVMGAEHYSANKVHLPAASPARQQEQQQQQQQQRRRRQQQRPTGAAEQQRAHGQHDAPAAQLPEQQQQLRAQHVLMGPDVLRLRLLAARGYALVTVSSFEATSAIKRKAGAIRELLLQKLDEAVKMHEQYTAANGGLKAAAAAAYRGSTGNKQQLQSQALPRADMLLTSLIGQDGHNQAEQQALQSRMRTRVQQRKRGKQRQQEGLQTLLVAASTGGGSRAAEAAPAGSSDDSGNASTKAAPAAKLALDCEFDLHLDLSDLFAPTPDY